VRSTFDRGSAGTRVCSREPGDGVRGLGLRRGLSLARGAAEPAASVFRVLGSGGCGVDYLLHEEYAGHAAVVCVGAPGCEELAAGISALGERGVPLHWAGLCSDGLLFVVDDGEAVEALGTLHGSLLEDSTEEAAESYSVEEVA